MTPSQEGAITYQRTDIDASCVSASRSALQKGASATQTHTSHSRRKYRQTDFQNISGAKNIKKIYNPKKRSKNGAAAHQLPVSEPYGCWFTAPLLLLPIYNNNSPLPQSNKFVVHLNWFSRGIILLCDSQIVLGAGKLCFWDYPQL